MDKREWLSLSEYSRVHHVSVSTLRRRIKSDQVEYGYRNGKYYIKNKPLGDHGVISEPKVKVAPPQQRMTHQKVEMPQEQAPAPSPNITHEIDGEAPILATANKLLNELKKAYTLILQEKEEQIIQLKEQVADLQTLVRVLEKQMSTPKTKTQTTSTQTKTPQASFVESSNFNLSLDGNQKDEELYISPTEPFIELSEDPWLD